MERNRELRRAGGGGLGTMKKRRKLQPQPYDRAETSDEEEEEAATAVGGEEEEEEGGAAIVGKASGGSEDEEDDDLPPPVVHRREFKHPHRNKDCATPVDLAVSVPRKLRTAVTKRSRESPTPPPPQSYVGGNTNSNNDSPKKKHASNGTLPSSNLTVNASLKSIRKMKSSNNSNIKPAKTVKISPTKQEVEVAETLYDLARMFVNQAKPTMPTKEREAEPKPEVKSEAAITALVLPASVALSSQSTQHAPIPGCRPSATAANSSTQTSSHLGASKRIHSLTVKVGEKTVASAASSPCLSTSPPRATAELADVEQIQQKIEPDRSTSAMPLLAPVVAMTNDSHSSTSDVSVSCLQNKQPPTMANNCETVDKKQPQIEASHREGEAMSTKISITVGEETCDVIGNSVLKETAITVETGEMLVQSASIDGAPNMKFEIDLMAPPEPNDYKMEEHTSFGVGDPNKKEKLNLPTVAVFTGNEFSNEDDSKIKLESKFEETKSNNEANQFIKMVGHGQCKVWDLDKDIEEPRDSCQTKDYLRQTEMQDVEKQSTDIGGNFVTEYSQPQKDGRDSAIVPPMITRTESSVTSIPLSISLGLTSWPIALPSLRYYPLPAGSDVASSYPPLGVPAASSMKVKTASEPLLLGPSLKMQSIRKHCAMHVYITHFIDFQKRLKQNPLYHSESRNSILLCGAQGHNANGSVVPAGAIFGNNKESDLMGPSISNRNGLGIGATNLSTDSIKERELVPPVFDTAYGEGRMEMQLSSHVDALEKKPASQQQVQTVPHQSASYFQIGSSFDCPITQSATAGDNIGKSSAISTTGGSSMPSNTLSVGSKSSLSSGSIPNTASVHTQFLHPVIQHPTFPISFSTGQAAPSFGGHLPAQQAAQYFGNPFYGDQLVQQPPHPQQSQQVANVVSGTSDPQKRQHQPLPSICTFASLDSPQQPLWPPSHGDRTLIMGELHQSQQLNGIGRQAGTLQQKPEMHVQPQHHLVSQLQQQHPLNVPAQLCVVSPLQMSLKDVESHTSQSLSTSNINRGPPSAVTSVGPPQGHTFFHGIGNQSHISVLDQCISGQSQKQQQCQNQQHPTQMQILVSRGFEDGKTNTNEGSYHYVKGACLDGIKLPVKHQINHPYLEASNYIQGSPVNRTYSLTSNCTSPQNVMATTTQTSVARLNASVPVQQPSHSSRKQMGRTKAASSSNILSSPIESTVITFSDRSSVDAANFSNSSIQGFPFSGQNLDSHTQCRNQGHSQQSAQMKVVPWASAGSSLPLTSGTPQGMLAARCQGQLPKSEKSGFDTIPTSRASPAPSTSSFSGSTLPSSPVSKSGGAAAKDSYAHSHHHKSSSATTSGKKSSAAIAPNMAPVVGSRPLSQNSSSKFQAQMVQNQPQLQKQAHKQQQRKQHQMSQTLSQQSTQYLVATQQESQNFHLQQSPSSQQQAHILQRHASLHLASQNQPLGDIQQQPVKRLQYQQVQIQQPLLRQQSPQLGLTSSQSQQFDKMQQQNLKHPQQHHHIYPSSFGIVTNGVLPSTLGTNIGSSPRNCVSDGAVLSQSSILTPSTSLTFTVSTNEPSSSQKSSIPVSVIQNREDGPIRSGLLNQQQILPLVSNPGSQPLPSSGTIGNIINEKSMTGK